MYLKTVVFWYFFIYEMHIRITCSQMVMEREGERERDQYVVFGGSNAYVLEYIYICVCVCVCVWL